MINLDNPTGTQVNKDLYENEKWILKNPLNFIIEWIGIFLFIGFEKITDLFNKK